MWRLYSANPPSVTLDSIQQTFYGLMSSVLLPLQLKEQYIIKSSDNYDLGNTT